MSTPKIITMPGKRGGAHDRLLNDENLKLLHTYLLLELITVRGVLRERGLHDEIKTRLVDDDGRVY
jgi:hypothetical protein